MKRFRSILLLPIMLLVVSALPTHAARAIDLSRMALRLSDMPKGFSVTSALDLKNQPGGAEEFIAGFVPKQTGASNSCMGMMCSSSHPGAGLMQVESDITLYRNVATAQHAITSRPLPARVKITPVGQQFSLQYTSNSTASTASFVLLFREGRIVAAIQMTGYNGAAPNQIGYMVHDLNRFAGIVDGRIKQAA